MEDASPPLLRRMRQCSTIYYYTRVVRIRRRRSVSVRPTTTPGEGKKGTPVVKRQLQDSRREKTKVRPPHFYVARMRFPAKEQTLGSCGSRASFKLRLEFLPHAQTHSREINFCHSSILVLAPVPSQPCLSPIRYTVLFLLRTAHDSKTLFSIASIPGPNKALPIPPQLEAGLLQGNKKNPGGFFASSRRQSPPPL